MKVVFITNMVHHHQIPLADEFYKILGYENNFSHIGPGSKI